jgi:hypothetical protein
MTLLEMPRAFRGFHTGDFPTGRPNVSHNHGVPVDDASRAKRRSSEHRRWIV